ncbi:hypothetical protein ACP7H9_09480 [Idiomarina sp. ST20R2A10]|uniref:hypothetical protein n=1 Tax=unclassified Idiomarina TaxID=2614829 RepID=UPI003A8DAE94
MSKNNRLDVEEREALIERIALQLLQGEISQGQALQEFRKKITAMNQSDYAELTKTSRKTVSEVENDLGNYSSDVINRLFKPFGLKVGLVPASARLKRRTLKVS